MSSSRTSNNNSSNNSSNKNNNYSNSCLPARRSVSALRGGFSMMTPSISSYLKQRAFNTEKRLIC